MADSKFDRRSFLQLATSGLAGAAISPTTSPAEPMPNPAAGSPRPAASFAYGYGKAHTSSNPARIFSLTGVMWTPAG